MTKSRSSIESVRAHKRRKAQKLEQDCRQILTRAELRELRTLNQRITKPKPPVQFQWNPEALS